MAARVLFLLCAIGAFASPLFLWSAQKDTFLNTEDSELHDTLSTTDVEQLLSQLISRKNTGVCRVDGLVTLL